MNRHIKAKTVGLLIVVLLVISVTSASPAYAAAPGEPSIGFTSGGNKQVTVAFTPPASDGGSDIRDYTVTSNPGNLTATGDASPITVTGLTNGTVYTFTVTARNDDGIGLPSAASNNTTARPFAPTTGTINNLVVFIRFSDQPEFTRSLSYYDSQFNLASNSLRNFYLENSYNTLTVNSFLYSSSNGSVVSYQDANPTSYYQPYDAVTNPGGYYGAEGAARETALVTNALDAISAQIPDELELDGDHDGYVDHITFEVYSTTAKPQPVMFYSRATFDTSGGITIKGIPVGSYTWVAASQDDPGMYPGATAIHEMGHSFGYPDLRANSGRTPVGNLDIMSLSVPVHSGAYMKYKFTKWISDIPEITSYGTYSINDITEAINNSYKIKLPNNEFLILEYRKAAGPFESNLSGSGLCITRINESAGIWGNLGGPPFFLYYYRTDGTVSSDGIGANFQCLSSESGRTQFNDYSNPACFLSDGSACGISIYNIGTASGSSISFSVGDPNTTVVTHVISGYLYNGGNRVNGATVTLSGDATGSVTTVTLGKYQFVVNAGGNYTITPAKANLTFNPVSKTFNNVTSDQVQNFPATNNTNTISGTVTSSGAPLSGVPVYCYCTAGGNYSSPVTTDSSGTYSFIVNAGGDCQVYPVKTNYFFTPASKNFTNITADQVQNFATWTATVNLTGTIISNGSPLSGVDVSCPGANTTTPITTDGSGAYSFNVTVGNGSVYTVTPSSSSYSFSPANRFYTGLIGNQSQNFIATLLPSSSTLLVSSANPSISGQSVTFTATVSGSTPTGTVTFDDGVTSICTAVPLSNGQAQCSTSSLCVSSHSIFAVYSGDGSNAGSISATLTQVVATVPDAPTSVSAVGGNGQATIYFSAPAYNGGSTITGYTVTSDTGSFSATGSTSPITITGLTNGTAYAFTVIVSNIAGPSSPSAQSNSVTPLCTYDLNVTITGSGTVTADTGSLSWFGNTGTATYTADTQVILTAAADASSLISWSGACNGNANTCSILMSSNQSETATFNLKTDFAGSPKSGSAPLAVSYNDESISPTAWLWEFGDGATSTEQNPVHLYQSSGTYSVSLTATITGSPVKTTKSNYVNASSCNVAPVKTVDTGTYDSSIQSAFSNLGDKDILQIQGIDFSEILNPPQEISFKLSGGYSCDYSANPGFTTVHGKLTISHGTVTVENLIIQ